MVKPNKLIVASLILISILTVVIFYFPNSQASDNISMVQMFEPDEAAPFSYLMRMITPVEGVEQTLRNFVFYDYYYYGFPHFSLSALSLLPLRWTNQLDNIPLIFLTLRQVISLIPMLLGLLLLVYMQDGFRTYRSIVGYIFLLAVPAVVRNNFWWHPDGLVVLLSGLILYLLWKDDLRFGWRFLLAAVLNGVLIAAKLVGVYFFMAIGLALFLGLIQKKISLRKSIGMAFAYIGVMAVSFIAANPFLLSGWARTAYRNIFYKQTDMLSQGYGVVYEKGLSAFWSLAKENYGYGIFILLVISFVVWGIFKGQHKYLYGLILAWFIPLTVWLIYFTHFKFQYWLPVALPLISCITLVFPEKIELNWQNWKHALIRLGLVAVIMAQFVFFIVQDVNAYSARYRRAENNERIAFYDLAFEKLEPITKNPLQVYYDYRLYVPETDGWQLETTHDLLDYDYIEQHNYDVLLLLDQRIRDYINPNVVGIDSEQFPKNLKFYTDANKGTIQGYKLYYRNEVALIYIKNDLVTP